MTGSTLFRILTKANFLEYFPDECHFSYAVYLFIIHHEDGFGYFIFYTESC